MLLKQTMTSYAYPPKKLSIPLSELAERLALTALGNPAQAITGLCSADEPTENGITFLSGEARYLKQIPSLLKAKIGAIILSKELYESEPSLHTVSNRTGLIISENPKETFFQMIPVFYTEREPSSGKIHPTAIIPESCNIESTVDIGAYVVLGEDVTIESGSIIHPGTVIYSGVKIGKLCCIHSGAHIREGVVIGDVCTVQNGAVIGADGFGYVPDAKLGIRAIPQVGTVSIHERVDIGALAAVDRATLGTTVIGTGTKLDNMVQIGHNVHIGNYSLLCAQVGVGGSSRIGDQVVIGGQTGVADHRTLGNSVRIAGASAVTGDLKEPGNYQGSPAVNASLWRKRQVLIRKLQKYSSQLMKLVKKDTPSK